MDISSLYNISSGAVKAAAEQTYAAKQVKAKEKSKDLFGAILDTAVENLHTTNSYISDMENEEIKVALGETDNTHDLSIALQKASTALQYTVAVRDKFLEAYREIMQMQI